MDNWQVTKTGSLVRLLMGRGWNRKGITRRLREQLAPRAVSNKGGRGPITVICEDSADAEIIARQLPELIQ